MSLEQFKDTLRRICAELENLSITNDVYWEILIGKAVVTHDALMKIRDEALLDPGRRERTRQDFSDMWKTLDDVGTSAFFEEMLNSLPPTDKPN